jgi:site-specific recombinase XerC
MNKPVGPPLGLLVQNFFCQRLQAQQQVSPHTLASYRDTLRLLLAFVGQKTGRTPSQQTLWDWNGQTILSFLDHLEKERGCPPAASCALRSCVGSASSRLRVTTVTRPRSPSA